MSYTQWVESEGSFSPVGNTVPKIQPGYYDVFIIQGQIHFEPVRPRTDDLLEFPSSASQAVLKGIRDFWDREDKFRQYGLPFKRGVLLYGPPGSGKTSTLQIVAREVVERGGIVVTFPHSTDVFLAAYRALRDVQPETPMVVLLEDFETILRSVNESRLLNLLDGVESIDRTLFVACHTPDTRILTTDLRWVPAGDIEEGDEIWALDEHRGERSTVTGRETARRFKKARVVSSFRARKECVRVHLDTGESFVCTTDHPWLSKGASNQSGKNLEWTQAANLLSRPNLIRPFMPWTEDRSYDAGWLAGLYDGEGHVSQGRGRASGIGLTQKVSPTADRMVEVAARYGTFTVDIVDPGNGWQKQVRMRSTGGAASAASILGTIRPERLIEKFDLTGGIVSDKYPARVIEVEPVGVQEIQSIETTAHTYFAEGFAVHNTTNYPEKLDQRIVNRPSRFDIRIPVSPPNATARKMYLESLLQSGDDIDIERYVTDTDGMSLAHAKELFVSTVILGVPYAIALRRLQEMENTRIASTDAFDPEIDDAWGDDEPAPIAKTGKQLFTGQYL